MIYFTFKEWFKPHIQGLLHERQYESNDLRIVRMSGYLIETYVSHPSKEAPIGLREIGRLKNTVKAIRTSPDEEHT
ncbi:hypothetical protein NEOLI_001542 [Neolecta irregularis DAH-3]|uniref:Uncharacterized protein n=1 Tax=Neolecta irregularis (strain DAH-3) TaxID=1198029 RepID=A0A1U7LUQ5_NEOID|nr:hypothetical protein NEOLI_001542 [Neolecta irregularis DAH-3]|eukprot:OLL26406.1 hypothetical protein NEOLI_001542 [Neolecta irregularis DAH-3]